MERRYVIAPSASRDLQEIADYYLMHNVEAGEQLFQAFTEKCQQVARFPYSGRRYSHIRADLRGLTVSSYIMLYRVTAEVVEVVRFVNGRRNMEALFENDSN
ncbi:type II toxin-antitoxin system RelE/ParE family toxin [Spirulina major]|uniref:type II toxin-antitoxin system RelE/ParE family toxin n=1 Tax=Spirulina major TaxID=270636 RepID=UPI00093248D6|nr:type II toxin-antitoxin system RelE/ParE family toxin [Spirulina major]